VGWAQINRSALIRIPHYTPGRERSIRAELRFPDPSANPYLAFAVMLASGLDGIKNELPCPEPLNHINIYTLTEEDRVNMEISELPGSLAEALRELEQDKVICDALGSEIIEAFRRAKWSEVEEYRTRVTDWELERYLEVS
jgi:glutamine synthetase